MTSRLIHLFFKIIFCLALVSCKAPLTFSSSEEVSLVLSSEITAEDQEVVEAISLHADSDSKNAFEGDVFQKAFLEMSFPLEGSVHTPLQDCVKVSVLEETDTLREVLYRYDCRLMKGTVQFITEFLDSSVISKVSTDVEIFNPHKPSRLLKSRHLHERMEDGSIQNDKEFEETYRKGEDLHVISGVSFYDFASEKIENAEGVEVTDPNRGYIEISGSAVHTKNGETQSLRTISSEALHRSGCGFDTGKIKIKNADKNIVVTFKACGIKTITIDAGLNAE